jgi:hypothetical protein
MIRDKIKNEKYFRDYVEKKTNSISEDLKWLDDKKVKEDRILIFKRSIADAYISLLIAKYSAGFSSKDLLLGYKSALKLMDETWDGFWKLKVGCPVVEYDQYILSAYDEMLWMLSLGYLLDISNEEYQILVNIIDRDKVKDYVFEYIIRAKLKDRIPIREESYKEFLGIPKIFSKLRQAIFEPDRNESSNLIKSFLENDWYEKHRDSAWYDAHKSKHGTYIGYWSFESAAIVKIRELDDSSFKTSQYYPADLININ